MTEPFRSDASSAGAQVPERDRDARVEDLLLSGLDHYFAGQHDLAINVWTRVLFLDRGHARARAYIERARGAIAERQREGEELVHTGAAAFQRGESDAARRLVTSAVEHGVRTEEAQSLLERIDRLEAAGVPQKTRSEEPPIHSRGGGAADGTAGTDRSWLGWIAAGVVLGIAGVALAGALLWNGGEAWGPLAGGGSTGSAARAIDEPLPVPSAADVWLSRARALHGKGHLREALDVLDAIGPGDPLRPQADELRATIQAQLLAAGRAEDTSASSARPPQDGPRQ